MSKVGSKPKGACGSPDRGFSTRPERENSPLSYFARFNLRISYGGLATAFTTTPFGCTASAFETLQSN